MYGGNREHFSYVKLDYKIVSIDQKLFPLEPKIKIMLTLAGAQMVPLGENALIFIF